MLSTCKSHFKSLDAGRPSSLAEETTSIAFPLMIIGSAGKPALQNVILTSLHLVSFSWNPLAFVFSISSSIFSCKVLLPFLFTDSDSVVSSTYFQRTELDTDRSFDYNEEKPWGDLGPLGETGRDVTPLGKTHHR